MYMKTLDAVLAEPEIDDAIDQFSLSTPALRMRIMSNAGRVFSSAPHEFAIYKAAMARETDAFGNDRKAIPGSLPYL